MARDRSEIQLRDRYSKEVIDDILRLIDEFINYNERFREYWLEVSNEVKGIN